MSAARSSATSAHMTAKNRVRGTRTSKKLAGVTHKQMAENMKPLVPGVDGVRDREFSTISANDRTRITDADLDAWSQVEGQSNLRDCTIIRSGTEEWSRIMRLPNVTRQRLRAFRGGAYLIKDETGGEPIEDGDCYLMAIPNELCHGAERQKALREEHEQDSKAWDERDTSDNALRERKARDMQQMRDMALAGPGTEFSGRPYDRCKGLETADERAQIAEELRSRGRPISPSLSADQRSEVERVIDERFDRMAKARKGSSQHAIGAGFDSAGRIVR
jgi:hypothetical protein